MNNENFFKKIYYLLKRIVNFKASVISEPLDLSLKSSRGTSSGNSQNENYIEKYDFTTNVILDDNYELHMSQKIEVFSTEKE